MADTLYTVTLLNPAATGFRNLLGTPLFSPYTWSFRTRPNPVGRGRFLKFALGRGGEQRCPKFREKMKAG